MRSERTEYYLYQQQYWVWVLDVWDNHPDCAGWGLCGRLYRYLHYYYTRYEPEGNFYLCSTSM